MMNEDTLPPRKPNTIRTWLKKAWDKIEERPDIAIAFLLGFIAGAALL